MADLDHLNDQTTDLTLKTKAGAPACTTSIVGMTPEVEAAAVELINGFRTNLDAAIAILVATISPEEQAILDALATQVGDDINDLVALVLANA